MEWRSRVFGAVACSILKATADRILCYKWALPRSHILNTLLQMLIDRKQIWNSSLQMRIAQKTDFVPSLEVRYNLEQLSELFDALPAVSGIDSGWWFLSYRYYATTTSWLALMGHPCWKLGPTGFATTQHLLASSLLDSVRSTILTSHPQKVGCTCSLGHCKCKVQSAKMWCSVISILQTSWRMLQ